MIELTNQPYSFLGICSSFQEDRLVSPDKLDDPDRDSG